MNTIHTQYSSIVFAVFVFVSVFSHVSIVQASEITPDTVIELVNQDRASHGFQSLQVNDALTRAAQEKVDDMAKNVYFAHTSPQGVTPWYWIQRSGYDYRFAGENLAIHFTDAQEEEMAWMASVKHRENILNPKYRDIGVAAKSTVQNEQETIIVVQMFGLSSSIAPPVATSTAPLPKPENIGNALALAESFFKEVKPSTPLLQEQSAGHFETTSLRTRWLVFLIGVVIAGISLLSMALSWRVLMRVLRFHAIL